MRLWSLVWLLGCRAAAWQSDDYWLDDAVGLGRQFDGIGAVSGGGVGELSPLHGLGVGRTNCAPLGVALVLARKRGGFSA